MDLCCGQLCVPYITGQTAKGLSAALSPSAQHIFQLNGGELKCWKSIAFTIVTAIIHLAFGSFYNWHLCVVSTTTADLGWHAVVNSKFAQPGYLALFEIAIMISKAD